MTTLPPLLALALGKKVRARKPQKLRPKESQLQFSVAKLLTDHCLPTWRWTHIASGELRDIRTAVKLKRMGLRRGWPDFLLLSPHAGAHCLELKRRGGKLSEDQEEFRDWCLCNGV